MILNVLYFLILSHHLHVLNELSVSGLYNLSATVMYVLSINVRPCDVWGLHDLSVNGLYDLSANGLYVLSIDVLPLVIRYLHELSGNGMNAPSLHVCSCGLGESGGVAPESGIHVRNVLNGLGT